MSSEPVFFLLIVASVVVFVVHAVRDERVRSANEQFWCEHISKYNNNNKGDK